MAANARSMRAETTQSQLSTDTKPTVTGKEFARSLGPVGITSILRTGSLVWPHGSNENVFFKPVPESVEAIGAQICSEKVEQLRVHEAIMDERELSISSGIRRRDKDNKIDHGYYVEYDQARFEYRKLLLDIIVNAVNVERREKNPHARGMILRETEPLLLDDQIFLPYESFTIYDLDLMTPAMTLYLTNALSSFRYRRPSPSHHTAFQADMAVQMKINKKLLYQGMIFNGGVAQLELARINRASDVFASHKTDVGAPTYSFPENRNVFVVDMINLLRSHTDHRKVYTKSKLTDRWNPRKGPYGRMEGV